MPPKGFRSLQEDTLSVSTRIPLSLVPAIEAHTTLLRRQTPYLKVSQADALRDLLMRGLQTTYPDLNLFGVEDHTQLVPMMGHGAPIGNSREPVGNHPQALENLTTPVRPTHTQPMAAAGMKWCAKGLHQYSANRDECPDCARLRKRNQRARAKEQAPR
jgi:hypothetical protein